MLLYCRQLRYKRYKKGSCTGDSAVVKPKGRVLDRIDYKILRDAL